MSLDEITKLRAVLNETIAQYFGNDAIYDLLRGNTLESEFRHGMTRTLLESGFLFGQRWMLEAALDLDRRIRPEAETTITTIHTHHKNGELVPCYEEVTLNKSEGDLAWQKWRLAGVRERVYRLEEFPTFSDVVVSPLDPRRAVIHSNRRCFAEELKYTQDGMEAMLAFRLEKTIPCSIDSPYRFAHRAVFQQNLPERLMEYLKKAQK